MFIELVKGFSTLALSTFWSSNAVEGCPVHFSMFSSIPGLYPLDASSPSPTPVVLPQSVSKHLQISCGDKKLPLVEKP